MPDFTISLATLSKGLDARLEIGDLGLVVRYLSLVARHLLLQPPHHFLHLVSLL